MLVFNVCLYFRDKVCPVLVCSKLFDMFVLYVHINSRLQAQKLA